MSCQVWLNSRPILCNFLVILVRRVLGFMLLISEFAMWLHWIILLSLISFLFHSIVITNIAAFVQMENIHAGQSVHHYLGQNAHTCRRFIPMVCQLISCRKLMIIVTLNTLSWYIAITWKCRRHFKLSVLWISIKWTKPLANVSPSSCWECLEIWQEGSWAQI